MRQVGRAGGELGMEWRVSSSHSLTHSAAAIEQKFKVGSGRMAEEMAKKVTQTTLTDRGNTTYFAMDTFSVTTSDNYVRNSPNMQLSRVGIQLRRK